VIDREEVNGQPFARTHRYMLLPHRGGLVWQCMAKPRVFWRWRWHCGRMGLRRYPVTLHGQRLVLGTNR